MQMWFIDIALVKMALVHIVTPVLILAVGLSLALLTVAGEVGLNSASDRKRGQAEHKAWQQARKVSYVLK